MMAMVGMTSPSMRTALSTAGFRVPLELVGGEDGVGAEDGILDGRLVGQFALRDPQPFVAQGTTRGVPHLSGFSVTRKSRYPSRW
jgi:hypothetical protein